MEFESLPVPKSLQSYIDQFASEPDAALARLEAHVVKRNTGALGYFYLASLHHKNGSPEKAKQAALNAKILAPGSTIMNRLHYFLTHPHGLKAWEPRELQDTFKRKFHENDHAHPIQDLDSLIAKLSAVENKRIKPDLSADENQPDLSEPGEEVDDIVTETLAVIHEKQKNYAAAIQTYKKLRKTHSSRKDHYDEQIFRLQELLSNEEKS